MAVQEAIGTEPPPPPATGSIAGTVSDGENKAIEGTTVKIEGTSYQATTGSDGSYTLADVEVGTYSVTASKQGYTSETKDVTVIEDDTVTLDFALSVQEEPPVQTMYVDSVIVTVVRRGVNAAGTARVTVLSNGSPVSGATVAGTWTVNGTTINATGTTDGDGVATIGSGIVRASSGQTFIFCVNNVQRDGFDWDGNVVCGSGVVP